MNLLITGCCGHIGSYIIENVHKIKCVKKTFAIDNLESNRFGSLFNLDKTNNVEFFFKQKVSISHNIFHHTSKID